MIADPVALARAARLVNLGRPQEAELILRGLLAEGIATAAVFALLSAALRLQKRWVEAADAARSAIADHPGNPPGYVALTHALLGLGRDGEALESAREAVRLDPHSTTAIHALAQAAMDVSLPEAEAAARTYQEMAPYSAVAHSLRASVEIHRKRWPEAEQWLRESLRCDPMSAACHANLALVLDQQGRREEARAEHQEAVRLDPQREVPRQNLHQALRADRTKGSAGDAPYDAALVGSTLAPAALGKSLVNVIMQALRDGRLDEARATAAEAHQVIDSLASDDLDDRRTRIRLLAAMARAEFNEEPAREVAAVAELAAEAREVLRPAELQTFLNNLGAARLRAGDPLAADTMTEVLTLMRATGNPNNVGMALLNLGAAHSAAQDDPGAERCYLECLDLALANGHAARAVRAEVNLAQMRLRHDEVDRAAAHIQHALELVDTVDEPMLRAKAEVTAGGVQLRQGDPRARRTLLTALHTLERGGEVGEVDGFAYLAEVAAREGRPRLAALHLRRAGRRAKTPISRAKVERTRAVVEALR